MKRKRIATIMVVGILLAWSVPNASADALISNVPDWNQPSAYGVAGYPGWCSPTAGGNIMGYWEDVKGCTGLTDRQVESAGPGYPATPGTWQQGLFNDGQIEMGWHMNTGGWQGLGPPIPFPPNTSGTQLPMIAVGLIGYATGAWVDNSYPLPVPAPGTGIVKVAYPNVNVTTDPQGTPLAAMWPTYTAEIDAGRPVECTFVNWVDTTIPILPWDNATFPGATIEEYAWLTGESHSVVGVGYYDLTPAVYNGDEYFICQDGWGSTGQYVRVPVDFHWWQNDYVHDVPEPATMSLLVMGGIGLLIRRKKK